MFVTRIWTGTAPLATVTCALLLAALGAAAAEEPCGPRCVQVDVVVARRTPFASNLTLTGSIAARFQTNVAFRTSGKIVQRLAEIGEHVTADQVLAKLDPRDQTAARDTTKAALASAEALLVQAKVNFERQQALLRNGFTTRPSFDQAQQQLRVDQANVESAKASLATAEEQLGYTDLKAGFAGIITGREAEAGQVVQAGGTVFTLAQDGPRDAVFDVYEAALTEPPASKSVRVFLQYQPSIVTVGSVREISPSVDDKSATVRVKVGLDNVPREMMLGASVVGTGSFKPREAVVLPRGALYRWNDAPAVWVYDEKKRTVEPRVVDLDRYEGDSLVLDGGIKPGEAVVTAGIQFLHPGQTVHVSQGSVR